MCPQFGFLKLIRFFVFYKSFFFVIVIIAIFISRKNIVILCERCLQDMEWKNDTPASNKKKKQSSPMTKNIFFESLGCISFFVATSFCFVMCYTKAKSRAAVTSVSWRLSQDLDPLVIKILQQIPKDNKCTKKTARKFRNMVHVCLTHQKRRPCNFHRPCL